MVWICGRWKRFDDVVSDVSHAESAMRGEIFELERRRFWRDENKPLVKPKAPPF
jgi:hypothetical protein